MMMRHARRGRPKTARHETDKGTPELQRKKQAGETLEVMDAMRLYLALPEESLKPAYYFRWLHSVKFGLPHARTTCFDRFMPIGAKVLSEQERVAKAVEYGVLCERLAERGLLSSFMDTVIYDRPPLHRQHFVLRAGQFHKALCFLLEKQKHPPEKRSYTSSQNLILC